MRTYIVTVAAADRVGIVHGVTGVLRDQGGNILEVSQTVMRGYFTIILAVEFDGPRDCGALRAAITTAGRQFDLTAVVLEADPAAARPQVAQGERFILSVLGDDHVGNIHGIAGCLAAHGVNIVDLHARADGPRFSLILEAFLPPNLPPSALQEELKRFGCNLGLDAYVQHENIFLATNEPRPVRVGLGPKPEGAAGVPH
jgi:glycine cleavage system transcriptional repressor